MSRSQSSSPYGSPTRFNENHNDKDDNDDNAEAGPSRSRTSPSSTRASRFAQRIISEPRALDVDDVIRPLEEIAEEETEPVSSRAKRGRPNRSSRTDGDTDLESIQTGSARRQTRSSTPRHSNNNSNINSNSKIITRKSKSNSNSNSNNNRVMLDLASSRIERNGRRRPNDTADQDQNRNQDGGEEEDDRDGFESREQSRKDVSERIKRGWETRRANKRARLERGEALIHRGERDSNLDNALSNSTSRSTPLPTSHMLLSLHDHSTGFYETNNLIFQPIKKGRANPWGSKKRLLIMQDALRNSRTAASGSTSASASLSLSITPASASRSRERDSRTASDIDEDGDAERSEIDELDTPGEMRIKSEFVDQYGELIITKHKDKEKEKNKGKTKAQNQSAFSSKNRKQINGKTANQRRDESDYEYEEEEDDEEEEEAPDLADDGEEEDGDLAQGSAQDEEDTLIQPAAEAEAADVARKRAKGKYKIRDMYRAIEGRGLMALGILVQEHIIHTLHSAGYRPRSQPRSIPRSLSIQGVSDSHNNNNNLNYDSDGREDEAQSEAGSDGSRNSFLVNQKQR